MKREAKKANFYNENSLFRIARRSLASSAFPFSLLILSGIALGTSGCAADKSKKRDFVVSPLTSPSPSQNPNKPQGTSAGSPSPDPSVVSKGDEVPPGPSKPGTPPSPSSGASGAADTGPAGSCGAGLALVGSAKIDTTSDIGVNVRKDAGPNSTRLGGFAEGAGVKIWKKATASGESWACVTGTEMTSKAVITGWIIGTYLK